MTCIPAQEGTCADSDSILAVTCTPGCSCMEGYVRHEGKCITFTDCPGNYKVTIATRSGCIVCARHVCLHACLFVSLAKACKSISVVSYNELFSPAVVVFFSGGNSYSVLEGDGICLSLRVSGNVNRDFEVTMNLGKQFAAGLAILNCI